jgi:hypothetical protein
VQRRALPAGGPPAAFAAAILRHPDALTCPSLADTLGVVLEFRETELFTRAVTALLSDAEYAELQGALIVNPEAGDLIKRMGGLRKLRWGQARGVKGSEAAYG